MLPSFSLKPIVWTTKQKTTTTCCTKRMVLRCTARNATYYYGILLLLLETPVVVKSLLCVQVAKYLANPLCRGVYAGDSSVLSMRSCFPIFYNLEQNFTSIIIGSLLQKKGWSTQSIYNVLSHTCVVCTQRSEWVLDSIMPVEIYKKT